MTTEFESICGCQLDFINILENRFKLASGESLLVKYVPWRESSMAREFEKAEINEMFRMGPVAPVSTEWLVPIVFSPKTD